MTTGASPYKDTVILDSEALNKLIKLVKTYPIAGPKTGITLVPANDNYNLQIQNSYHFASTSSMTQKDSSKYDAWENEINSTFTGDDSWSTKHAACICLIDTSVPKDTNNLENGRYMWLQGGSLLEFITDDGTNPNGSFVVNENNGTKVTAVRIKGFNDDGTLHITSTTGAERYNNFAGSANYQITDNPTTLKGSITTMGGIAAYENIMGNKLFGSVFNDYAEYRQVEKLQPGSCVVETGKGDLVCSTKRLQGGANIISDTFGFAIGETAKATTPIAVCGRVLAIPAEDKEVYKAGDAVCSAPGGKISKMTREEIKEWPDRIVGYVSEIPNYENWGTDNIAVNNRIWIKIK